VKYREFIDILLGTIGYEAAMSGETEFRVGELLDRYGLEIRPQWKDTITKDLDDDYRSEMARHIGPLIKQRISLSGDGISWFEDFEENFTATLESHGLNNPYQDRSLDVGDQFPQAGTAIRVDSSAHAVTSSDPEILSNPEHTDLQAKIDSTNWTGLAKRISPNDAVIIKEKSQELQRAIMQSQADIETKTDACKRVEAVLLLLEAPNVPWREVVHLLNHPAVTAMLVGLNLIQFIIGLAAT
jgi:hypothetical protein